MKGKIIIDAEGAKRYLPAQFAVCGDREDIERLGQAIIAASKQLEYSGWVYVNLNHPASSPPNTKPLDWADGLPHESSGT